MWVSSFVPNSRILTSSGENFELVTVSIPSSLIFCISVTTPVFPANFPRFTRITDPSVTLGAVLPSSGLELHLDLDSSLPDAVAPDTESTTSGRGIFDVSTV